MHADRSGSDFTEVAQRDHQRRSAHAAAKLDPSVGAGKVATDGRKLRPLGARPHLAAPARLRPARLRGVGQRGIHPGGTWHGTVRRARPWQASAVASARRCARSPRYFARFAALRFAAFAASAAAFFSAAVAGALGSEVELNVGMVWVVAGADGAVGG